MAAPTVPQLQQKLSYAVAQRKFAWAKYYEEVNRDHHVAYAHHGGLVAAAAEPTIPAHIKAALTEMATTLKKKYECPVCIEMIEPDNIVITNCGHFYCKGCLDAIKAAARAADARPEAKYECPTCRRKHRIGGDD
jgi:hypothetical protein